MPLPVVPEEREQGAVQAQEQLEATAPAPLEPTPAAMDEQALANVAQSAAPASQAQSVTVKNPYMLLPARFNFATTQGTKTPVERRYDVGMLWDVLASDPNTPEITRIVARGLMGKK